MRIRRPVRTAAAIGAAVAALVAFAVPASASDPNKFGINYTTTGSTTLSNPNSAVTVTFKKTNLGVNLVQEPSNAAAAITGVLPLAPVKAGFDAYGFLPASGTVVFTEVGPITGLLGTVPEPGSTSVRALAEYVVTLRDVTIGGAAAKVGNNCQTARPVFVHVVDDGNFDLITGDLTGTYNLGQFQNCGPASHIINDVLPGKQNTLHLHICGFSCTDDSATARTT